MKGAPTVSVNKLHSLFRLLEQREINVKAFLESCGIEANIASCPDRRLQLDVIRDLNQKAAKLLSDNFIGLHQGEVFTGFSSILGYVLMNCRDVAETMDKYARYQQLVDEGRIFEYRVTDDFVTIEYRMADTNIPEDRHHTEHLMMGMVTYSRILTGWQGPGGYREVHFVHASPGDTAEYERLFGCRPQFRSKMNALIFDKALLALPVRQPDRNLLAVLESYAQEVLNKLQNGETHTIKIKRLIINALRGESPTIKSIAARMHMSVRNLQLKLKEEGTSYSALLAEGRKELAQAYLKDRNVPIEEIAYLLGFSEPSVFHRTFKRWTGITPGLYRRQVSNAQPFPHGIKPV